MLMAYLPAKAAEHTASSQHQTTQWLLFARAPVQFGITQGISLRMSVYQYSGCFTLLILFERIDKGW